MGKPNETLDATIFEKGMPKVLLSMDYGRREKLQDFLHQFIIPAFFDGMTRQNMLEEMSRERVRIKTESIISRWPNNTEMEFILDWFVIDYRNHRDLPETNLVFKE